MASSQQTKKNRPIFCEGKTPIPDLLSDLGNSSKPTRQHSAKSNKSKSDVRPVKAGNSGSKNDISFINKPGSASKKSSEVKSDVNKEVSFSVKDILSRTEETDPNRVYEITLRAEKLRRVPDLKAFKKIRILDLSSNELESLTGLEDSKDLRELKIYDNSITHLFGIEELKELNILQAQHNKIVNLDFDTGKGLHLLKKLKLLRLDSNQISRIDLRDVTSCLSLTSVDVSFNSLQSLAFLNCLPNLEELFASHNQITEIPELNRCKKLTELKLSKNKIGKASGLAGHISLLTLDLEGNLIQSLKTIGKIPKLENLNLANNHLQDLDKLNEYFPVLDVLDISSNFISDSNNFLNELKKNAELRELYLLGNRFPTAEPEQRPFTHNQILQVIPSLEILDGMTLRKPSAQPMSAPAPCMRPMTASSAVSTRFVQNQMDSFTSIIFPFESKGASCYEQIRQSLNQLPKESPQQRQLEAAANDDESEITEDQTAGDITDCPSTAARLISSRCNRRARLEDALNFASTQYDKQ